MNVFELLAFVGITAGLSTASHYLASWTGANILPVSIGVAIGAVLTFAIAHRLISGRRDREDT